MVHIGGVDITRSLYVLSERLRSKVCISDVFLFVEEFAVAHVAVWVVAGHSVWRDLLIAVSEVDWFHVVFVENHVWVECIVVPEVVRVVLSAPMASNHVVLEASHAGENVHPEDTACEVEI